MSSTQRLEQPRGPHGPLERPASEEGDLRVARVRDRFVRDQHHLPDEDDHRRDVRTGRIGAGRHDPLQRLQAACRRRGADPESFADDDRSGLQERGRSCDRRRLDGSTRSRRSSHRTLPETAASSPPTSIPRSCASRSADPPRTRWTRSTRSSLASPRCRRPTRSCTSARSARAPARRSPLRSATISSGPDSSRCR